MTAVRPNKIRLLVLLTIFIMISSAIPALTAIETNYVKIDELSKPQPDGLASMPENELNYWCDTIGFLDEPEINNEKYNAECIAEFGPELAQRRTKFSNTYVQDDGLVTVRIYSGEVNYENPSGGFKELNTEVKEFNQIPLGTEFVYDYACEANSIRTYFRNGYSLQDSILTKVADDQVAWEPIGLSYINNLGDELEIIKPNNREPLVRNNKVFYPGSYPNAADVFTVENHKLKHEIILDALPPTPTSTASADIASFATMGYLNPSPDLKLYVEDHSTPIVEKVTTKNTLAFQTEAGTNLLQLPTPVAYELNHPTIRTECEYMVEPLGDRIKLSISTPFSWLSDPARSYPVVIDPTLVGTQVFRISPPESLSNDTFIASNNGLLEDENYGEAQYMFVGGWILNYSGLIQFDLSSLPANDIPFESALLKVKPHNRGGPKYDTGERNVAVHEMLEAWKEGSGTINTPTTDGATYKSTGLGSAWTPNPGGTYLVNKEDIAVVGNDEEVEFNIENLVTKWRGDASSNFGLIIRYNNSLLFSNVYKSLHTSNKNNPKDYWPKLDVTFRNDAPKKTTLTQKVWLEDQPEGTQFFMDEVIIDPNLDDLTIKIWNGEDWGNKFECGIFNATLQPGDPMLCVFELKQYQHGTQDVIFNATDRIAYTEAVITIDVRSVNNPPVLKTIGPQQANEEEYLYLPLKAIEVEGQTIKWNTNVSDYQKENFMDNIYIQKDDKYKATLVYLPKNSDVPVVYVNVSVQDQMHTLFEPSIDWEHVTITVANVNDDPSFIKIDGNPVYEKEIILTAVQNKKKLIHFQAYDDDILNGDDLEFSSDAVPGVDGDNFTMVELLGTDIPQEYRGFNTEVAMVEWRPQNKHVGEYIINANVSDKDEAFDSVKLRFLVKNVNDPPVIVSRKISDPEDYEKHTNREFVNLSCVVDDPDLYILDSTEKLNVTWYSNVSKLLGYGTSIKNIKLKAGMHEIEILVKDASGEENNEARDYLLVVVEKAITLQKYCDQSYGDFPPEDDIEYSYNDKTKKFTVSQGRNEEANPINLSAYYDNGKLVIELTFATDIELTTDFIIKIYIVTDEHNEPTPNYKKEYSSKFFEVELYQPPEDVTYGFFSKNDGFVVNDDMFVVKYSLADLEIGTSRFEPLKANFKIFAIVKWHEIEYFPKYRVENFRYDSIGYGAAIAPPPISSSNGGSEPIDTNLVIGVSTIIIIIIIILIIIFLFMRKKKAKEQETVIDFSKPTLQQSSGSAMQQPTDINQMFMSPFEQQFIGGPGIAPSMPGQQPSGAGMGMGMESGQPVPTQPGQSTPVPTERQVPQQQIPQLPPKQPQSQPTPQLQTQPQPQPQSKQTPSQTPQPPTQLKPTPQPQPTQQPQPQIQSQPGATGATTAPGTKPGQTPTKE